MNVRKIARDLRLARNSVRKIIAEGGELPASSRADRIEIDEELLRELFAECDGYRRRVFERLTEEGVGEEKKKYAITYPTLTRRLRELGIGDSRGERCDRVPDEPGKEMQHDTTVYQVSLGEKETKTRVVASLIYLRYSKRRYLRFYRAFTRFHMKCFFHEALTFWGYSAPRCVIDNTNLARLRGSGRNAVIVPEMEHFSKPFGFRFQCHEIGHANRKAGNERSFFTVETNFLPGRRFESLEDLNAQGIEWATVRLESRPQSKKKLIPAIAFEYEKNFLTKLPAYLPAPYLPLERTVDQYGFAMVDANFYWVPGDGRGKVKVLLFSGHLEIYRNRERLIDYPLPQGAVKNKCFSPEGQPKPRQRPKSLKKPTEEEEKRLRSIAAVLGTYLDFVFAHKSGRGRHRFVRELFRLSQRMSAERLSLTVERALKYGITSIETIWNIAALQLRADAEPPLVPDIDESFRDREAYLEGQLTDAPDFSLYEDLREEDTTDG